MKEGTSLALPTPSEILRVNLLTPLVLNSIASCGEMESPAVAYLNLNKSYTPQSIGMPIST